MQLYSVTIRPDPNARPYVGFATYYCEARNSGDAEAIALRHWDNRQTGEPVPARVSNISEVQDRPAINWTQAFGDDDFCAQDVDADEPGHAVERQIERWDLRKAAIETTPRDRYSFEEPETHAARFVRLAPEWIAIGLVASVILWASARFAGIA